MKIKIYALKSPFNKTCHLLRSLGFKYGPHETTAHFFLKVTTSSLIKWLTLKRIWVIVLLKSKLPLTPFDLI